MVKEQNGQKPGNESLESETSDRLHTKMDENDVGDHKVASSSTLEEDQQQMSQSFSWSVRNVAVLASLCVAAALLHVFAALSMIAPFYPHEVSLVITEKFIV